MDLLLTNVGQPPMAASSRKVSTPPGSEDATIDNDESQVEKGVSDEKGQGKELKLDPSEDPQALSSARKWTIMCVIPPPVRFSTDTCIWPADLLSARQRSA